ncbi:MAG TPA: hypothetical protein DEB24_00875 [Coriobacteriia bacterium]|nr:hypothetical protein [Coriobacteriia bacterium]
MSAAVCVVPSDLRVGEKSAETVLALRPTLSEHACKQSGIGRFADKIVGTTLPHLVEHLTIDLLVERALAETHGTNKRMAPVAGNTRPSRSNPSVMIVTITSPNLRAGFAEQALKQAIALVNRLLRENND